VELWYSENHTKNVRLSIKVKKQLYSGKSDFQQIDVFQTKEFGNILTLDGYIMLSEKDEFIYHEMITHVPMSVNPDIKKVLVIGGGDGGAVRELTRYNSIEWIDLCEIDRDVVNVCREYLPKTACRLDDERVHIHFEDGLKFVRDCIKEYDLIIVDSTDPFGPGEGLFTKEFYGNCYKALTDKGIMVNQNESCFYENDAKAMQRAYKRINSTFEICRVYSAHIPTYPSGYWLFGFASKRLDPINDFDEESWLSLNMITRYYNPELHRAAFALPTYV
jgi:spermidine synthase